MIGVLYVVGTPIGNMEDITIRALKILESVDLIAAEDTRVTAKLLNRHSIKTPSTSFREQNANYAVPILIEKLKEGINIALVSDAGTPSISDPGQQLVLAAVNADIKVSPIPGPSALGCAISVSALVGDGVRFIGFLPRSGKQRKERLKTIGADPSCTVIYESPHRLKQTLKDLCETCDNRNAVVLRELTKMFEEIVRGTLCELANHFAGNVKGEITIVIEGNAETIEEINDEKLREIIKKEIEKGSSAKDTAACLAAALGIKKKTIYSIAVELLNKS